MKNKMAKIAVFLLYILLIFQSYVIPLTIGAIDYDYDIFSYRFLFRVFCPFIFIPWRFIDPILPNFLSQLFETLSIGEFGNFIHYLIFFNIPLGISFLFVYLWLKRQSPMTAWGIAFLGSCYAFLLFPMSIAIRDGDTKTGLDGALCFMRTAFIFCRAWRISIRKSFGRAINLQA